MSVKVNITVVEGPNEGSHHELSEGSMTIGRGKCDLVLRDKKVSSTHCRVRVDPDDSVWLEDVGSTNGTFVAGRRIDRPEQLRNLDDFVVGLSRISVAIVEEVSVKSVSRTQETRSISRTQRLEPEAQEIPDDDAKYRETGIHRIQDLIDDEMKNVSAWDSPGGQSLPSGDKSLALVRVHLKKLKGPESLNEFICSKSVTTMGRKNADIKLNDLDCSRVHAQIEIRGKKAYVKDLASTNGTFVNGRRVTQEEIKSQDVIQVGQTFLEVTIEGGL